MARRAKKKIWSEKEEEELREFWGVKSINVLAKRFNVNARQVINKASVLKLGTWIENSEYLTFMEVITALGQKSSGYAYKRLKKLNIPLVKVVRCQSKEMVDMKKFWEWAEENKKQLNFAKFEKGALGKEPDWVDEKRKLDYKNPTKHSKKWSKESEQLLIKNATSGKYTLPEIAKDFARTESAIRRKLSRLGVKSNFKRLEQVKWDDLEKIKLVELEKEHDIYTIAKMLNRSETSVTKKLGVLA